MTPGSGLPRGFFDRIDPSPDAAFYSWPRLVTHIDDGAIAAVGTVYEELGITGRVLDLMSSWLSHFRRPPEHLTVLGMDADELARNVQARVAIVHDLDLTSALPFASGSFDAIVFCVSVDYLIHPIEVFTDAARVMRPGGPFVCAFSNRCLPTRAIRGWLESTDEQHLEIVAEYVRRADGWDEPVAARCTAPAHPGDPLLAVWAHRST